MFAKKCLLASMLAAATLACSTGEEGSDEQFFGTRANRSSTQSSGDSSRDTRDHGIRQQCMQEYVNWYATYSSSINAKVFNRCTNKAATLCEQTKKDFATYLNRSTSSSVRACVQWTLPGSGTCRDLWDCQIATPRTVDCGSDSTSSCGGSAPQTNQRGSRSSPYGSGTGGSTSGGSSNGSSSNPPPAPRSESADDFGLTSP